MAFNLRVEDGTGLRIGEVFHLSQPTDANTLTISDGTNTAVTFEYDNNASITGGNVSVTIGGTTAVTATNLANAISAQRVAGNLDVTVEFDSNNSSRLLLRNQDTTTGSIVFSGAGVQATSFQNTNSYLSLAEADDILKENIHATDWVGLPSGDRERLLVFATKFLDDRTRWNGTKTVDGSPLRWPRSGITDRDGQTVGDNEIPEQLKRTVAYLAHYNAAQDRTIERSQDALDSLRVDVVELDFKDGYKLPQVPNSLHFMLDGLGSIRSGSQGFAKIIRS